jgi:hypothetical protein
LMKSSMCTHNARESSCSEKQQRKLLIQEPCSDWMPLQLAFILHQSWMEPFTDRTSHKPCSLS